jgi:hypothetical protein
VAYVSIGGVVKKMCFADEGIILLTSARQELCLLEPRIRINMKLQSVS